MLSMLVTILSLSFFNLTPPDLGEYFGFAGLEVIKIGKNPGPMYAGDMNNDGLLDILVINNRKSRIDVLLQKIDAKPGDEVTVTRANEIPEHWRYDKQQIMVAHKVSALALHDFNHDGRVDIIYAGNPTYLVFLEQTENGEFKKSRTHRLRNLNANRSAFSITNIVGDDMPELVTIVRGNIQTFPIDHDSIGKPTILTTKDRIFAFELADFDGNGLTDIIGIAPDDSKPLRLWLSNSIKHIRTLGPQLRFEMPPIREFVSVSLPELKSAMMAIIERVSRRIVLYEIDRESIATTGDREASIEIYPFLGNGSLKQVIADVNNDGLLDLIATNPSDNTIVVYTQTKNQGLTSSVASATLSGVDAISVCDFDKDGQQDLFVLSENEGVVGRSPLQSTQLSFPKPIPFTAGNTPVSLSTLQIDGEAKVAVISKEKRAYVIDLINLQGDMQSIGLGSLSRAPDEIIGFDANQDGKTDLLLLTRDKPMKMLQAYKEGFQILDDTDMGQFGLVREASADNTAIFDVDNDGVPELLIAHDNYVRAVRYETETQDGVSPGWQVVTQINMEDGESSLISLAINGSDILVADKENQRIIAIRQDENGSWYEGDSIFTHGYDLGPMYAGDFSGDGVDDILAIGETGFAIIQLQGDRVSLHEKQSWRSENDRRVQHELAVGDINADGFTDIVSLDAGEQMLEIFTFSKLGKMLYATGFKIFESRIFSGGDPREWQPSQVIINDFTNDGKKDVLLLAHDRLLMYRQ